MHDTFLRRVRLFCELRVGDLSSATGVTANRIRDIEAGKRIPNRTERALLQSFLRDKFAAIVKEEGGVPAWLSPAEGRDG